jgi:uncharacterized membrane protein YfcA
LTVEQFIFAGLVFFAAYLVSTITGFGANVVGVPLLALVLGGIEPGKQSLVVLGMLLYIYVVWRHHQKIDWRQLRVILLVAGIGAVIGLLVAKLLPHRASNLILALFVMGVGARGLLNVAPNLKTPMWLSRIMLFLGGAVHGALTTGGPLIVIYTREVLHHKSVFRSTLAVMWLILGAVLIVGWTITKSWDPHTGSATLIGLPFLVLGTIIGEQLHHRVDEQRFRTVVNVTLIATGSVLLWENLK